MDTYTDKFFIELPTISHYLIESFRMKNAFYYYILQFDCDAIMS